MRRFILKSANVIISLFCACVLCIAGIYAIYALWDNYQVYEAAKNVQDDMLRLKPQGEDEGEFKQLLAVNSDVVAWITLDHTNIDYPVLQGDTNLTYINTDVYGNFALAGSIFLDSRCDRTFQSFYSLLYGHHMANDTIFADLDLYKEQTFFKKNKTGKLKLPDGTYDLEIIACLVTAASDENIFGMEKEQSDMDSFLTYIEENALYQRKEMIENIRSQENPKYQILAMSTCSYEFTDARTVVLAAMQKERDINPEG